MPSALEGKEYGSTVGGNGLLRVASNAQIDKAMEDAREKQTEPVISGLAAHVRRQWESARDSKQIIQRQLLANLRQRNGEYESSKLAAIKQQGGSEVYMQITQIKCRTAKAWLKDVLGHIQDKPWSLEPTPIPDIPPEIEQAVMQKVTQEIQHAQMQSGQPVNPQLVQQRVQGLREEIKEGAKKITKDIAKKMEMKLDDDLKQGDWGKAFDDFLDNLVTFKSAFMKGPVVRRRKKLKWQQVQGEWKPVTTMELTKEWYAPSPFDIYPAPDARSMDDSYLFEKHRLTRRDLEAMKGVPGYDTNAINLVLEKFGQQGFRDWILYDQQREEQEQRPFEQIYPGETIDAVQYWGWAQGKELIEWGMDKKKIPDPMKEYAIESWLIKDIVIRAVINDDPLSGRPYYKTGFMRVPGSFWDKALPELITDVQDVCNASARALVNNLGIASGPQIGVNVSRMPDGEDITEMYPWKVWQFGNHEAGISEPPIQFFQPTNMSNELIRVFDYFSGLADNYTGVPNYVSGDANVGGAGKTASGLSMLMGAASKGIKELISSIDIDIIEKQIRRMYDQEMLYGTDTSIKGDISIVAKGAISLFVKEQQAVRRNEFLATTNNPVDFGIMGQEGRAELLRSAAESLDLPKGSVIPSEDELKQREKQAQEQMMKQAAIQQNQEGGPQNILPGGATSGGRDSKLF